MITIPSNPQSTATPLSEKDIAVVKAISEYVNDGDSSPLKVGMKLAGIHRALHEDVFRLFTGWLRQMAIDSYKGRIDTRNKKVSNHATDIYDFLISEGIVRDENYLAETMR